MEKGMGTDIAMFVERREGSRWVPADPPKTVRRGYDDEDSLHAVDVYSRCGPNTALAEALADGARDDDMAADRMSNVPPLPGHPRGMPRDASPVVMEYAEYVGELIYRVGWMTVRELLDLPWDEPCTYRAAYVRKEYAELFDGTAFPAEWPADRELYEAVYVSDEVAERRTREYGGQYVAWEWNGRTITLGQVGPVYARVQWVDGTLAQIVGDCVTDRLLPHLRAYGDPDAHRVIYWTW
jgi:hypothetical protein